MPVASNKARHGPVILPFRGDGVIRSLMIRLPICVRHRSSGRWVGCLIAPHCAAVELNAVNLGELQREQPYWVKRAGFAPEAHLWNSFRQVGLSSVDLLGQRNHPTKRLNSARSRMSISSPLASASETGRPPYTTDASEIGSVEPTSAHAAGSPGRAPSA